ncbi:MAG: ABC transporter permease [Candidatus Eremiobacterota bacterium]
MKKKGSPYIFFTTIPVMSLLFLPVLSLLLKISPDVFISSLQDYNICQAILLTLSTSSLSVLLIFLLGTPLAYLMAWKNFRGKRFFSVLIDLPSVLPPAVAGLALLIAFGRRSFSGTLFDTVGIEIAFTPIAVILAQMFVSSPYYIKSAINGFSMIPAELIEAAEIDGASEWKAFKDIILPLSRRSIVNGIILSWARAVGEFGATIIFAGNYPGRTQTMSLAVYLGLQSDLNKAITLAVILLVISFIILFTANKNLFSYELR